MDQSRKDNKGTVDQHSTLNPEEQPKHQRRKRYKGTHPKSYSEKYKELQPEKYAETIARVIQKGSTPAGMHISICVNEILEFLQIRPGQIGLDATLGYGGHTLEMLRQMESQGHLYALDVDPFELPRTRERLAAQGFGPEILTIRQMNFSNIDLLAQESGPIDFILADLGVSSMQIDNPERGFSFKTEGPLDLRLNPEKGLSAAQRLRDLRVDQLTELFVENSDEPHAEVIARSIMAARKRGAKIDTTTELREIIAQALMFLPKATRDEEIKKSCQRCFQALRIDVNQEFEVLYQFLEKLPQVLAPGGRVAILSFHSGEDRLVKKSFQRFFREGIYREIATGPIRPSAEECSTNSRARSAKLRWAIKA
ncbi:16S rRNA (cytosine(1402)-N(4))-methyltransferase RsmH [Proteiniclasticum sp. QWL-01]|uniref:16S rRNA (cytosine(1402)-N(4))-methyltransferase RsmH n=1 Tax=Proteiniclasticum sp. QWL-01 TaxID=3036945 RepID=UPI0024109090|nr:16S rRNA (cytosine(1402)-N(4))-methyltransferase RsmH [Proteiniclasticum sp. QWL-01]WFF71742.1 16S rRNA (cytosine(1402)-N(4))-methyltransferase RsmH [Proteiniclasticum sp. QWL-01]